MYHYIVGIGCYPNKTVYVDSILEIPQDIINEGLLVGALNKETKRTKNILSQIWAIRLRSRYQMTTLVHLKFEEKLSRELIETYINSLSNKELDKLLKEAKF